MTRLENEERDNNRQDRLFPKRIPVEFVWNYRSHVSVAGLKFSSARYDLTARDDEGPKLIAVSLKIESHCHD